MGLFDELVGAVTGALSSRITKTPPPFDGKLFYKFYPQDWFKQYPFSFQIRTVVDNTNALKAKDEAAIAICYLPIPPQSITVQQIASSVAHATIGGVVEEVSAPVFWTITLTGTTGLSMHTVGDLPEGIKGRATFADMTGNANLAGKLSKSLTGALSKVNPLNAAVPEETLPFGELNSSVPTPTNRDVGTKTGYVDKIDVTQPTGGAAGFFTKMGNNLLKGLTQGLFSDTPDVTDHANGYAWDQLLRQFFLIYQKERCNNNTLGLYFIDEKSNTAYQCVPRSVQFNKTAGNPFISQYTIILQCWNLRAADDLVTRIQIDRFDPKNGDLAEVYTVTSTQMVATAIKAVRNINRASVNGVTQDVVSSTLG